MLQDRYQIMALLGQGGMGSVYRAYDHRLQVDVAIKEMAAQAGLMAEDWVQMCWQFQEEAHVLARLNHPNLVTVSDYFDLNTRHLNSMTTIKTIPIHAATSIVLVPHCIMR